MYFHYTNIESLFHIIKGKKVWFSSLAFMNDEMEGFDLHQALEEVLELKYGADQCENTLKTVYELIDTYLRFQMSFSATTLKDDISQWRAYTALGSGVSLEFEDGFINCNIAKRVECLYDFADKKSAIIADRNLKAGNVAIQSILSTPQGLESYVSSLVQTLVSFKNSSFKPEQEVRWVISLNGVADSNAELKYRPHRLGLTSYQEVNVELDKIKSITLGPQVSKQNKKTFEDFLIENECAGYVTESKVTLR